MRRRDLLRTALGLETGILLTGCAETDGGPRETVGGGDTPTDSPTSTDTPTPTSNEESTSTELGGDNEETSTPTEAETDTPTESPTPTPVGEANVQFDGHELVVDEREYTTEVYVAATVVNEGDAPSGTIELTAEWYDGDGNYLDNSLQFLQSLGAGETWAARIYYLGTNGEEVDNI